jgi:glutathione S-transferase
MPSSSPWLIFHVDTYNFYRFQTYFPHIDNVYSHRSTQQYKRWPMVSHYWGCRLKGRPGGTPKSSDPNVKKRKRTERPRDLCKVVIKITEHFPGRQPESPSPREREPSPPPFPGMQTFFSNPGNPLQLHMPYEVFASSSKLPEGHPGSEGRRYFTIQRVNGNGLNGKDDGVPGGHTHTLEESDQVKKDSVQRYLLKKQGKGRKKVSSSPPQKDPRLRHYQQFLHHRLLVLHHRPSWLMYYQSSLVNVFFTTGSNHVHHKQSVPYKSDRSRC